MDKIAKDILNWLVDTRAYKPAFKMLAMKYTADEHRYALSLIEKVMMLDIVNKFYDVEHSFTVYTKIPLEKLAEMVGIDL